MGRRAGRPVVDAFDLQTGQTPFFVRTHQGFGPRVDRDLGEGQQVLAAPFEIGGTSAVNEHNVRTGRARGTARAGVFGPVQSGAVGLRGIGCRKYQDASGFVLVDRAMGAQAVDCAGQRELSSAQARDEPTPPRSARLLEGAQDRVDAREPARGSLGSDRFARYDALPIEQLQRGCVGSLRR